MILLLVVLWAGTGRAADAPAAAVASPAETAGIRRFADELFQRGDWFRAATEYLRAASYDPAAPDVHELEFKAALCAYRAGQWTEARRRLLDLGRVSSTELSGRCTWLAAASSYRLGDYETARTLGGRIRSGPPGSPLLDRAAYLEGLSGLHLYDWPGARSAFGAVPPASPLAGSAGSLAALVDDGARLRPRNPWITAGLSAVVPGLGQVASGYVWDGLSALVLAGGSAAILAAGIHRNDPALKGVGAALLAVFYPANVFGGANAAGRRTREERRRLLEEADRRSTLSLE